MSFKQIKENVEYNPKPVLPICGNCVAFKSELRLRSWMEVTNSKYPGTYSEEKHGKETNMRCADYGFLVKKMASCSQFRFR